MRLSRDERGFSLVELMTVVVIIAVLVAIAIPVYQGVLVLVERRACQANLRTLDGAAVQYAVINGPFPATADLLENPAFIVELPTCPTDGRDYDYSSVTGRFSCDKAGHVVPN